MALAEQSAAQGGHRCVTPQHSTAQLQQQCCKRHQGAAAGITLPVAAHVPCNTACWCAGAAVCTQGPCCRCPPQRAAGRRAEPRLSACHERHPKIPAAEVRLTLASPWIHGGLGESLSQRLTVVPACAAGGPAHSYGRSPCTGCLQLTSARLFVTRVQGCLWRPAAAPSCAWQLHGGIPGVCLNACKQAADFEALSCRQLQT